MTPTEIKTLRVLESGNWFTKKDLAVKTGAARRTLYVAVRNLTALGFVHQKPSLRDTRQYFIAVTEDGRRFLQGAA